MKLKLLSLIMAMLVCVALFASCDMLGGNTGDTDDTGDTGDTGEYNYSWAQTEVLFEMNEHSNGGELESGVRRYYAGAKVDAVDDIDTAIKDRNKEANKNAKVTPKYTYLTNGNKDYGWGANVGRIQQLTNVGGSNCPDVFVNFAYDLTCAQLRGCFANLLDKSWDNGNHFYFANNVIPETDDYFNSEAGEGYFYEYMKSLSLTPDTKLYCVGSNYCVDLVRAFIVIPVNVELMNGITDVTKAYAGDRDKDGDHDIVDFYNLVWDNEWTYEALAAYSGVVFRNTNTANSKTDFADEVIGFVLGTNSGLSGAAMLYTSSVQIIGKGEDGKYAYPETNQGLTDFAVALSDLMKDNASNGICTTSNAEVGVVDGTAEGKELIGIRNKFAKNGVLFGGTIMVGSLEDTVYQNMKDDQGFGVVPVPLYKAYEKDVNYYQTLVHNVARIVAIAECSTEKAQASAYLDYQSRNSADILEEYYTVQLAAAVGGVAGDNNKKMLTYIRNHVRSCFDKTFEDAIADYTSDTDTTALNNRWHYLLQNSGYSIPTISSKYNALYGDKQKKLTEIYTDWNSLK